VLEGLDSWLTTLLDPDNTDVTCLQIAKAAGSPGRPSEDLQVHVEANRRADEDLRRYRLLGDEEADLTVVADWIAHPAEPSRHIGYQLRQPPEWPKGPGQRGPTSLPQWLAPREARR
jgi:hypothetical protein